MIQGYHKIWGQVTARQSIPDDNEIPLPKSEAPKLRTTCRPGVGKLVVSEVNTVAPTALIPVGGCSAARVSGDNRPLLEVSLYPPGAASAALPRRPPGASGPGATGVAGFRKILRAVKEASVILLQYRRVTVWWVSKSYLAQTPAA